MYLLDSTDDKPLDLLARIMVKTGHGENWSGENGLQWKLVMVKMGYGKNRLWWKQVMVKTGYGEDG